MSRSKRPEEVIAYLRVSTKKQGETGIGLDGQLAGISAYAKDAGLQVIATYRDVASAVGSESITKRDGVQRALFHAETARLPIIVYSLDRLTRDIQTFADVSRTGHRIISVADDVIHESQGLATAARAELEAQAISKSTREALQKLKASGVLLGNRTNLREAQEKGSEANRLRSEAKVKEIADFLRSVDDASAMSAPQIAELLNSNGILTGRQKHWTVPGLRRQLQLARELIKADIDASYENVPNYGRF